MIFSCSRQDCEMIFLVFASLLAAGTPPQTSSTRLSVPVYRTPQSVFHSGHSTLTELDSKSTQTLKMEWFKVLVEEKKPSMSGWIVKSKLTLKGKHLSLKPKRATLFAAPSFQSKKLTTLRRKQKLKLVEKRLVTWKKSKTSPLGHIWWQERKPTLSAVTVHSKAHPWTEPVFDMVTSQKEKRSVLYTPSCC